MRSGGALPVRRVVVGGRGGWPSPRRRSSTVIPPPRRRSDPSLIRSQSERTGDGLPANRMPATMPPMGASPPLGSALEEHEREDRHADREPVERLAAHRQEQHEADLPVRVVLRPRNRRRRDRREGSDHARGVKQLLPQWEERAGKHEEIAEEDAHREEANEAGAAPPLLEVGREKNRARRGDQMAWLTECGSVSTPDVTSVHGREKS